METGLSLELLEAVMHRVAEKQDTHPMAITTQAFLDLLGSPDSFADERSRLTYINRHLDYLEKDGFITMRPSGHIDQRRYIELTARGHRFLQPELAEFGQPILPQIITYVDQQIEVSQASPDEKQGWRFKLNRAVADRAVDVLVGIAAEVASRVMKGQI